LSKLARTASGVDLALVFSVIDKICAIFLSVVIVLPFTAPWAVCDIADLQVPCTSKSLSLDHPAVSVAAQETRSTQADSATVILPTLETQGGRLRLLIVSKIDASQTVSSSVSPQTPRGYPPALRPGCGASSIQSAPLLGLRV
jgi:hypothetical protein